MPDPTPITQAADATVDSILAGLDSGETTPDPTEAAQVEPTEDAHGGGESLDELNQLVEGGESEAKPADDEKVPEGEAQAETPGKADQPSYKALAAKVKSGEFDILDDGPAMAAAFAEVVDKLDAAEAKIAEAEKIIQGGKAEAQQVQFWSNWDAANKDLPAGSGRRIWDACLKEGHAKGYAGEALRGWASARMDDYLSRHRKTRSATPAKPAAAAKLPTAGRVPNQRKTVNDKLESGEYGNLAAQF